MPKYSFPLSVTRRYRVYLEADDPVQGLKHAKMLLRNLYEETVNSIIFDFQQVEGLPPGVHFHEMSVHGNKYAQEE